MTQRTHVFEPTITSGNNNTKRERKELAERMSIVWFTQLPHAIISLPRLPHLPPSQEVKKLEQSAAQDDADAQFRKSLGCASGA